MSTAARNPLECEPLESFVSGGASSPYELAVEPLAIDVRRPWPIGIPSGREVLEAIAELKGVASALKPAHRRLLTLLPAHLHDAVANALAGAEDPVASLVISCWRAMVAASIADDAYGVDQVALRALISEAATAREKVQALAYFSLDAGVSTKPLLEALGAAIEQLVKGDRFGAKPRPRGTKTSASGTLPVVPATSRALKAVCVVVMVVGAIFQLSTAVEERRVRQAWVVVGDVDTGRAFLAPSGADPQEANRRELITQLGKRGIGASRSGSGEWVLHRFANGTP